MIKRITYALLLALALPFLYFANKLVINYAIYAFNHIHRHDTTEYHIIQSGKILPSLQELTSIPLLGHLFIEEKLKILVKQKKWVQILRANLDAQGALTTKNSLNLLTYRAIAECATYQFNKCEKTIKEINEKVPHLYQAISMLDMKNRQSSITMNREAIDNQNRSNEEF